MQQLGNQPPFINFLLPFERVIPITSWRRIQVTFSSSHPEALGGSARWRFYLAALNRPAFALPQLQLRNSISQGRRHTPCPRRTAQARRVQVVQPNRRSHARSVRNFVPVGVDASKDAALAGSDIFAINFQFSFQPCGMTPAGRL